MSPSPGVSEPGAGGGRVMRSMAASFLAGTLAHGLLHPFDLMKTRRMVATVSRGAIDERETMRSILKHEGLSGLYRGAATTIFASGVSWCLFRVLFDQCRDLIQSKFASNEGDFVVNCLSGGVASFAATCIVHPLWFAKSRMEMQSRQSRALSGYPRYSGGLDCLISTVKRQGIAGLYSGFGAALALAPHGMIQMVAYEEMRRRFSTKMPQHFSSETTQPSLSNLPVVGLSGPVMWGGASKLIATTITYPFQTVRARQQLPGSRYARDSVFTVLKRSVAEEGVLALYSGFFIHVQRACVQSALLFCIFEMARGTASLR